jgi:hypothetical protein
VSWWSDVVGFLDLQGLTGLNAAQKATAPGVPDVNPGKVLAIPAEIAAIWANLRDGKLWRSVGWLLLGIILMLLGVSWWIGPSAERMSPLDLAAGAGRRLK